MTARRGRGMRTTSREDVVVALFDAVEHAAIDGRHDLGGHEPPRLPPRQRARRARVVVAGPLAPAVAAAPSPPASARRLRP